jgi:hypothetical protein
MVYTVREVTGMPREGGAMIQIPGSSHPLTKESVRDHSPESGLKRAWSEP